MSAPSALLSLLLVTALTVSAEATDYCTDITTCSDHTMCKYTTDGPSSSCSKVLERGVTDAQKTEIVDAHNAIRRAVKAGDYLHKNLPAAQTMPDLQWDAELATIAQRLANQCVFKHDLCRDVARFQVGQNMANAQVMQGSPANWTAVVNGWFFKELEKFSQSQTDLTFTESSYKNGIGHLTQVIWGNTTVVGCGFIGTEYKYVVDGFTYDLVDRLLVCNYGATGNVIGHQIYKAA